MFTSQASVLNPHSPKYVTRSEILSAFQADVRRLLLPPDLAERYGKACDRFIESLSSDSLQQHRMALRGKVNVMFSKILSGRYEPPLSAFLREFPDEIVYFYIDRIRLIESDLSRYARLSNEPVPNPGVWSVYWFNLLTKNFL